MRSTTAGTISTERYAMNTRSRPGKRRRLNAYAAVVLVTSCPATTETEKIAVLKKKRANGSAVSAAPKFPRCGLTGTSGRGWRGTSPSPISAVETI